VTKTSGGLDLVPRSRRTWPGSFTGNPPSEGVVSVLGEDSTVRFAPGMIRLFSQAPKLVHVLRHRRNRPSQKSKDTDEFHLTKPNPQFSRQLCFAMSGDLKHNQFRSYMSIFRHIPLIDGHTLARIFIELSLHFVRLFLCLRVRRLIGEI